MYLSACVVSDFQCQGSMKSGIFFLFLLLLFSSSSWFPKLLISWMIWASRSYWLWGLSSETVVRALLILFWFGVENQAQQMNRSHIFHGQVWLSLSTLSNKQRWVFYVGTEKAVGRFLGPTCKLLGSIKSQEKKKRKKGLKKTKKKIGDMSQVHALVHEELHAYVCRHVCCIDKCA